MLVTDVSCAHAARDEGDAGEEIAHAELDGREQRRHDRQADDAAGDPREAQSSQEMIVPETAPTANRIANAFDQRRASASQTRSPVRRCRPSAVSIMTGRPTPKTAKLRWKASDVPICARPAMRWLMVAVCLLSDAA